jgi:hypothetical protein
LDFIEDNYGLEILELESGNFLKEKIHFMWISFHFIEEFNNIYL